MSLRWTTCADFSHSEIEGDAGANVFVFETLPCTVLSKTKLFTKWLHLLFSRDSALPHSAGYGLAQSSGGHKFLVVVVSKSMMEVNTVVNVLDSARVEKTSSCVARFLKGSSNG